MGPLAIDSYAHLLPQSWTNWVGLAPSPVLEARSWIHALSRPVFRLTEKLPSLGPLVPHSWSPAIEALLASMDLPFLAIESTSEDLVREQKSVRIGASLVTADEQPHSSGNTRWLWLWSPKEEEGPEQNSPDPGQVAAIRILRPTNHPSRRTDLEWITWAEKNRKPVYLATRPPRTWWGRHWEQGSYRLSELEETIDGFPSAKFVLSHSSDPESLDLLSNRKNCFVVTADLSPERIGESVRRLTAGRVLFGSNWPWGGHKLDRSVRAVQEARASGRITPEEETLVLGTNAIKLFGIDDFSN